MWYKNLKNLKVASSFMGFGVSSFFIDALKRYGGCSDFYEGFPPGEGAISPDFNLNSAFQPEDCNGIYWNISTNVISSGEL